jgi:hypothetical protein
MQKLIWKHLWDFDSLILILDMRMAFWHCVTLARQPECQLANLPDDPIHPIHPNPSPDTYIIHPHNIHVSYGVST